MGCRILGLGSVETTDLECPTGIWATWVIFHLEKEFCAQLENFSYSKCFLKLHPVLDTERSYTTFHIPQKSLLKLNLLQESQNFDLTQPFSGWIGGSTDTTELEIIVTKELLISKN